MQVKNFKDSGLWRDRVYLIINEMTMVPRKLLAQISASIAEVKGMTGQQKDLPFSGV